MTKLAGVRKWVEGNGYVEAAEKAEDQITELTLRQRGPKCQRNEAEQAERIKGVAGKRQWMMEQKSQSGTAAHENRQGKRHEGKEPGRKRRRIRRRRERRERRRSD